MSSAAAESEPAERQDPPPPSSGAGAWLRTSLFAFHGLAVIVLSLPASHRMVDPAWWAAAHTRSEIARWSRTLDRVGVATTPEELTATLQNLGGGYATWRHRLVAPFSPYASVAQLRQGWSMFSSPQTHPAEVWIEIERAPGSGFEPVYVERSPEHRWRHEQLDHNRVRKLMGRLARSERRGPFRDLARWAAAQLVADFPDATRARFRIRRWASPDPASLRAGAPVEDRFTDTVIHDLTTGASGNRP